MILGLDLSLSSTGWAILHPDGRTATGLITPDGDLTCRLVSIRAALDDHLAHPAVEMIVIEDLIRNPRFGGTALGMVHAVCRLAIYDAYYRRVCPRVLYVPPATLKTLATGKGGAGKAEVLASAIRRLGYDGHSDDCSDAAWLADYGARLLGWDRPALPATHLRALKPPTTIKATRSGVTAPAWS